MTDLPAPCSRRPQESVELAARVLITPNYYIRGVDPECEGLDCAGVINRRVHASAQQESVQSTNAGKKRTGLGTAVMARDVARVV